VRPLLRWSLGTLLILLAGILLMLAAILFLPSGARFALNLTAGFLPQLELEAIEGTLTSRLKIGQLRYRQEGIQVAVDQLELNWQPWSLFESRLHIDRLSAAALSLTLPAASEEDTADDAAAPFRLPDIPAVELPLAVELNRFSVDRIQVVQGDRSLLNELSVSLSLHTEEERLLIDTLQLEQPGSTVQLRGWTEPARQFLSHLELEGATDLTRWVSLEHWPQTLPLEAGLVLDLDGARRQMTLELTGQQADTALQLQAELDAREAIALDYRLSAQGINPALAVPDWPGDLALSARGRVVLGEVLPQLTLQLESLQGVLRQQPLRMSADLSGNTRQWQIAALDLRYAEARARVKGGINDRLDLSWSLDAPSLAALLPDARGSLSLTGQLKGALKQPALTARIRGQGLGYGDQGSLETLKGDVALDLAGEQPWQVDLQLNNAEAGGQQLEQGRLNLTGRPEQHRLELQANGSPGQLELRADGGWQAAESRWQGQLSQLEIRPEALSHWRSTAAAKVMISLQEYRLESLCLEEQTRGGELCLQAEGDFAGRTQAQMQLSALALSLLEPFLNGMQLTPVLSVTAEFTQQSGGWPRLEASLTTTAGKLTPAQADQSVELSPVAARLSLADDHLQITADTRLAMVAGALDLSVQIDRLSQQQDLSGELNFSADDLSEVQVLLPELQNLKGYVRGELGFAGTLVSPQLSGEISYREGSVELPALGLLVSPMELQLTQGEQPGQLRFSGLARSGEGELKLAGEYNLEQQAGALTLKGEQFTVMNTQDIQALISPDLALQVSAEAVRLEGVLRVPRALISTPESRESAVQPDGDVVVVATGERKEKEPAVPVYADLKIVLGDEVRVDVLDFNGRLLGALQIEESPGQSTRATGSIQVESGQYRLYGQDLDIKRGSLVYTGSPVDNPGLDLRIGREVESVVVGANVSGTLREPRMELYGEPAMPDSSVLSYLLLGKAPGEGSASEQQIMMQAALALGMNQGNKFTGNLKDSLALDELGFDNSDSGESAFFIGKYLSPRLYLRYGVGVMDAVNTLSLKYRLSEKWRAEAQSSELGSGADLLYTLER